MNDPTRRAFLRRCLAAGLVTAGGSAPALLRALTRSRSPGSDEELRGVWLSLFNPADLFCRDGEPDGVPSAEGIARVVSLLGNSGFNTIFVMVDSWYSYSITHPEYQDANPLAAWDGLGVLIQEASARGMQVHPSLPLVNHRSYPRGRPPDFSPECGGSPAWRARYVEPSGRVVESDTNACPSRAETRAWQAELCRRLMQRYPTLSCLQLEEPGFDDRNFCACDECRRQFQELHGADLVAQIRRELAFGDCAPERCRAPAADLKCSHVTELIGAARQALTGRNLAWSATVSADRWGDRQLGRDWVPWARDGWLDFLAPMIYVAEAGEFRRRLEWGVLRNLDPRRPVCAGIGVHYRGSLTPGTARGNPRINSVAEVTSQIEAARDAGRRPGRLLGVSLFFGELLRPAHRPTGIRYLAELRTNAFSQEARVPHWLTARRPIPGEGVQ